jgi:TPR repeat protein/c-di-GMP-related signal transduction protein
MFTFFAHLLRRRGPALPSHNLPSTASTDAPAQDDDGAENLLLLRHAVLNRDKQVAGYEFVQAGEAATDPASQARAFLKLLKSVVAGQALGKRHAFVAVTADLLSDPVVEELARSGVVVLLRLDADSPGLPALAERMQAMRSGGMRVGLADARMAIAHPGLGHAASLGFLPVDQLSPPDLLQVVRLLGSRHPHLMLFASGVQSHEEYEVCRRLKVHGFTGPFATHRRDWSGKAMDPGTARLCTLVTSLRAGAEMDRVIRDIKLDPLLSVRVLAYANSAGIGAQHKVQTLKDAILLIGLEPLFRWLVLLLCASGPSPQEESAVLENALVRGRMMELLAGQSEGAAPEDCFMTGVLSLLDVMLQRPAAALFASLDLPDAARAALVEGQGPCASLLRLVQACEQPGGEGMKALCFELGVTPPQLRQAQTDALVWARGQSPDSAEHSSLVLEPSAPEPQAAAATVLEPEIAVPVAGDPIPAAHAALFEAAQQGHANAQWNAAVMLAHGQDGIARDEQQAFVWCQQAADQGFAPAQATLGLMYSAGQGTDKNLDKALELLEQAALQGDVEAQYNLAVLQEQELEGEQNLQQALAWFAKAAEQGLPAAQDRLGRMFAMGQMCERDLVEAYKWFFIANEAQHVQAQANLAYSLTLLQPEQVQEAESRANRWMQAHAAAVAAKGVQAAAASA